MLHLDRNGNTATVQLDHGRANVLDTALCTELTTTIARLDEESSVHAIVLAGKPKVFSAGVDLTSLDAGSADDVSTFLAALDRLFRTMLTSDTPLVAAVTGHAIAGGAVIAAACDHAVVSDKDSVRLGLSELSVGVPFPTSAIEILRTRCPATMRSLVWLAELHPPQRAVATGLVDEAVPADEVVARAGEVASQFAQLPAITREMTRQQVWAGARDQVAARGPVWEPHVVAAWRSQEVRAAISAFVTERLG